MLQMAEVDIGGALLKTSPDGQDRDVFQLIVRQPADEIVGSFYVIGGVPRLLALGPSFDTNFVGSVSKE